MSKLQLARRIAQVTGRNVAEALRFIRDAGVKNARKAVRAAENGSTWKLPATVLGGSGAVLVWREQDVRKAKAIAEKAGAEASQSADAAEALRLIVKEGDALPPDLRKELAKEFGKDVGSGDGEDDKDEDDNGNPLQQILRELGLGGGGGGLGGTIQSTVILLVIVVFILNWALNSSGQPSVAVGGGGA